MTVNYYKSFNSVKKTSAVCKISEERIVIYYLMSEIFYLAYENISSLNLLCNERCEFKFLGIMKHLSNKEYCHIKIYFNNAAKNLTIFFLKNDLFLLQYVLSPKRQFMIIGEI